MVHGEDDLTLEAARAIRGDLPDLLGDDEAAHRQAVRLDGDLARLLAAAGRGTDVREDVLTTLSDVPETRAWMLSFLTFGAPPDLSEQERAVPDTGPLGGGAPPGAGLAVQVPRFRCPRGDMTWYRRSVGQRVPRCPTHDLVLEPVSD